MQLKIQSSNVNSGPGSIFNQTLKQRQLWQVVVFRCLWMFRIVTRLSRRKQAEDSYPDNGLLAIQKVAATKRLAHMPVRNIHYLSCHRAKQFFDRTAPLPLTALSDTIFIIMIGHTEESLPGAELEIALPFPYISVMMVWSTKHLFIYKK